jgi:hypothetical protein
MCKNFLFPRATRSISDTFACSPYAASFFLSFSSTTIIHHKDVIQISFYQQKTNKSESILHHAFIFQKLAGGRRGGSRNRAWFLDSWTCSKDHENAEAFLSERRAARDDSLQDALDLPIELRRLEDVEPSMPHYTDVGSPELPRRRRTLASAPTPPKRLEPTSKSQSLGDILNTARPESLVRSRSSVARLPLAPASSADSESSTPPVAPPPAPAPAASTHRHPPLVRQKRSLCEDDEDEAREAEDCPGPDPVRRSDLRDLVRQLPEVGHPRRGVPKQRSLNDELMATHRQREKARVRQNITKQASLNEQLLGESRGRFGTLKDTLLASPRFQQLKSGITKLTTSMGAAPSDATKVSIFRWCMKCM